MAGFGGLELQVHEHGPAGAPTVVLVHGYPDDHAMWDPVVERLAPRHHVVAYDVRGAGTSGVPRAQPDLVARLVAEQVAAVEAARTT